MTGRTGREPLPVPNLFASVRAREHRYWWQTYIGVIVTVAVLLTLVSLVATDCYLVIAGNEDRIAPLMQTLQPYLLPPLGAVVGYAFGHHTRSEAAFA